MLIASYQGTPSKIPCRVSVLFFFQTFFSFYLFLEMVSTRAAFMGITKGHG